MCHTPLKIYLNLPCQCQEFQSIQNKRWVGSLKHPKKPLIKLTVMFCYSISSAVIFQERKTGLPHLYCSIGIWFFKVNASLQRQRKIISMTQRKTYIFFFQTGVDFELADKNWTRQLAEKRDLLGWTFKWPFDFSITGTLNIHIVQSEGLILDTCTFPRTKVSTNTWRQMPEEWPR